MDKKKIQRSTFTACCALLTYMLLMGFGLIGSLPGWVWAVALPLHFVAGMAYEQEKCAEVGHPDPQTRM